MLIITYTGDVGAPPYDDGVYHFGRTEWQEVQAAVEYVDAAGARDRSSSAAPATVVR